MSNWWTLVTCCFDGEKYLYMFKYTNFDIRNRLIYMKKMVLLFEYLRFIY
jgi:hypothetical protein